MSDKIHVNSVKTKKLANNQVSITITVFLISSFSNKNKTCLEFGCWIVIHNVSSKKLNTLLVPIPYKKSFICQFISYFKICECNNGVIIMLQGK